MTLSTADVEKCDPVLILKDSLNEMPGMEEDEVRYKIVIHSSEDDSLVRLLFQLKMLERQNARIYICSDFPGDTELQKVNVKLKRSSHVTTYELLYCPKEQPMDACSSSSKIFAVGGCTEVFE